MVCDFPLQETYFFILAVNDVGPARAPGYERLLWFRRLLFKDLPSYHLEWRSLLSRGLEIEEGVMDIIKAEDPWIPIEGRHRAAPGGVELDNIRVQEGSQSREGGPLLAGRHGLHTNQESQGFSLGPE